MALWLAVGLLGLFTLNVALGSFAQAAVLGDVGEMLLLLAASITFTIAILRREAARDGARDTASAAGRSDTTDDNT